jgi:hypothetical protein
LSEQQPPTPARRRLGLDTAVVDQVAAMAALGDGNADLGAARLDTLAPVQARADYLAVLAAAEPE